MDANVNVLFNRAIPGESWTHEFGSLGFQRPPEHDRPEDALEWHLDRLEEHKDKVVDALELGIPVKDLNLGMLRGAVANAIHDMDTMFILAPVLHEAIELVAEKNGIEDYKTGFEENLKGFEQIRRMKMERQASMMKDGPTELPMVPEDATVEEAMPMIEEEVPVDAPIKGLMARPSVEGV